MGKNVLKPPGVVHACPAALVQFILLLTAAVGVMSIGGDQNREKLFKQGLNMARVPSLVHLNISQTEFENKHREYFDLVEQNQRRRLNSSSSYSEESIVRKKLYRFTHSGLENSRSASNGIEHFDLHYHIHIPKESNSYVEAEETSIRLLIVPRNCATDKQGVTLKVVKSEDSEYVMREETFEWDECLPKWAHLDVSDGFSLTDESQLKVSIQCENCSDRGIALSDPYLNIIVNVKSRLRRRRAERIRKRRYPGKCNLHALQVDFGKLPGYQFVIQPKTFDAGLCAGRCPKTYNPASRHSQLQYLLSNMDRRIPKPCCAPSKMTELEILHPDEEDRTKLKVSTWENTRITECACS